ncbi:MAG: tetratricopeptide repeat protein [Kofleriaceae bacterium]|nr:tetratricopeptide repeat protein [Kofleriaceae bacterium]
MPARRRPSRLASHARALSIALGLVLGVGACGGGAGRTPKAPTPVVTGGNPHDDLARAKGGVTLDPDGADDPRAGTTAKAGPIDLDEVKISVIGVDAAGEPELGAVAAMDLLRQGARALEAGRFDEALARFRQLVTDFPTSKLAPLGLWNLAVTHDKRGDLDAEMAALRELVTSYPQVRESVDAHLHLGALLLHTRRWAEAERTLADALARTSLTWADRLEAAARRGYALLELGQLDRAEAALDDAVAVWKKTPYIEDRYFIAMAQYYRGEVVHRRFAAVPVRPGVDAARADLLAREQLATAAYDRWKLALELKQAYWATAAGYQMSQIFVEFWQATVSTPVPADLAPAAAAAYRKEVHDRMRPHLDKALDGHQMNVELGRAFGVDTVWAKASAQQVAAIMTQLAREARGDFVAALAP